MKTFVGRRARVRMRGMVKSEASFQETEKDFFSLYSSYLDSSFDSLYLPSPP